MRSWQHCTSGLRTAAFSPKAVYLVACKIGWVQQAPYRMPTYAVNPLAGFAFREHSEERARPTHGSYESPGTIISLEGRFSDTAQ